MTEAVGGLDLAADAVGPLLTELSVQRQTAERARQLCERCDWDWPINRGATGVAAGSIYLAAIETGEDIRQSDIAAVADCSVVTLRNCYHEINEVKARHDHD